ncbi:RNA 2',3'-cyclic phosphodiesterase [Microbulbifer bruguierae]|uniref:RNA 2',3'-cyclic phosphodiesterase n=1 Tax=Microbulbifer bruguierae TaxID=3029061 RepID=A0ABY8NG86_9GAMM|nr:RNA 2',3'-cyclic phosphodiesterase [Microbulbifer bruguierae]WGL17379.1 RNA 2',3'-cyclic phosphodiesterase [Microbulbifer bruguierae]
MQKNNSARNIGSMSESSRLFIGIAPDAATQRFLDATCQHCERLGLPRDHRWVSHSNRHLTLVFLDDTENRYLDTIEAHMKNIAEEVPAFYGQIVSTHPFPKMRGHLLAAELLSTPELLTLHQHCRTLMEAIGKQPERKSFRPHFTLARSRSGFARPSPVPADFICKLQNITLYHSLLAPGGSQYRPLLSLPLAEPLQN